MATLAIDTCFAACSVAIATGALVPVALCELMAIGHAERLLPMIDEALKVARLTPADIDRIVVTQGPGSFTGVRVGLSAARALSLAIGCPIAGTTSLHVMAAMAMERLQDTLQPANTLVVAVETRDRQLYTQAFAGNRPASAAMLSSAEHAAARLGESAHLAVGSGAQALASAASARGFTVGSALPDLLPDARFLLSLDLTDQKVIEPLYLREADAKPQRDAALQRA